MAPTNQCLLCKQSNGVFHSLGGCAHMKGMYIRRHNEAVWIILRSLLAGRLGASVVMHDAGHRQDRGALKLVQAAEPELEHDQSPGTPDPGAQQTQDPDDHTHDCSKSQTHRHQFGTRIPPWVYHTPLGEEQNKADWDRYRPDIMIAVAGDALQSDGSNRQLPFPNHPHSRSQILQRYRP